MENYLRALKKEGYLNAKIVDGEEILHLSTPCRFKVDKAAVNDLKLNYKPNEEIGGVLWVKPTTANGEIIYIVDKVSYIRNAIEDTPRNDHRNKTNAYLPDSALLETVLCSIFTQEYLPIRFHTHPTKEKDFLGSLVNQNYVTETSEQDRKVSEFPFIVGNKKLLMPRGLIVGDSISSTKNIFIGMYNGFIAPHEFEGSKREVQHENMERLLDKISSVHFTNAQKIGLFISVGVVVLLAIKYPKYSLPAIAGILALLPLLMTNTDKVENPTYFNKLSIGDADIFIPKI